MYTGYTVKIDHSYAEALPTLVSSVEVAPIHNAQLQVVNQELAATLGFAPEQLAESEFLHSLFSTEGDLSEQAVAQKYGGHQFGVWNPDLGDGRGLLLGDVTDAQGQRWDLHLKGAGQTPYSRFGDGRAVLRSTIREYLASEALHSLGIPSSRALCLISSDEPVLREQTETAAMLIRTCESHIRFGHFEYFYHSNQHNKLTALMDYTLNHHFLQCLEHESPHLALLETICLSTADLIAKWQAFGFCHGVMNTDNMSIHGITFDYGPYAFLDTFDAGFICNHSDPRGRYAFDQQPGVALWNLNALAHGFTPFLSIEQIKSALQQYEPRLQSQYAHLMSKKLGFPTADESTLSLVHEWLRLLQQDQRDYSQSFRMLSHNIDNAQGVQDYFIDRAGALKWYQSYREKLHEAGLDFPAAQQRMLASNPKYVLRNYLAQEVIEQAEQGNFTPFKELLAVLQSPFEEQPQWAQFASPPPQGTQQRPLSCSS